MKRLDACLAILTVAILAPVESRAEGLVIQSRLETGAWSTARAVYPIRGEKIVLRVEPLPGYSIRWYRIRPDLAPLYKNANHPWEKDAYHWVGWARIGYRRDELQALRGSWTVEPFDGKGDIMPSGADGGRRPAMLKPGEVRWERDDLGTFWIQAEAQSARGTFKSPGLDDVGEKGISPRVFRISVREADGFLGWLTSYFNVPGLFGAVTYQTVNYIGADCADVLMAACDRWNCTMPRTEASVASLVQSLPRVTEFDLDRGRASRAVRWGKDILPGDILAVRYPGKRAYQHVGALYADDGDGLLGTGDRVLHAGPYPLHLSPLVEGAFDGHCMVLRTR